MQEEGYIVIVNPCDENKRFVLEDISKYYSKLALITTKEVSWESNYIKNVFLIKEYTEREIIKVIENFQKIHHVQGVITYSERITDVIANVADYFGFKGLSKPAGKFVRDKLAMRQRFKEKSIPIPKFQLIKSIDEASDFVRENGFPVVLKPTLGGSSEAVIKVINNDELEKYFEHVYSVSLNSYGYNGFLIEEYVEGLEVGIESVIFDGEVRVVMITDKYKGEEPFFLEIGHIVPSQLPTDIKEELRTTAIQAIKALGIQNGVTHTEIKWTKEKGPKLIEIGGRMAGDYVPFLWKLATGVNLSTALVDVILGRGPAIDYQEKYLCSVQFISPEREGILLGYGNIEDVLRKEGALSWRLEPYIGHRVSVPPNDYHNRLGHYILKEESYSTLQEKIDKINKTIYLEIL
ncbi:MAG: ATP-grasp domain-containing protein [Firmicutes bacterium]|nr:ATP-grasp domain-containing protein [Bacillota bacterium]